VLIPHIADCALKQRVIPPDQLQEITLTSETAISILKRIVKSNNFIVCEITKALCGLNNK
jgi:hypothetical protein